MMNTVDESVLEGPIEIGMTVFRTVQANGELPTAFFWYKVWHISPYRVLDLDGNLTNLVWVKDPEGLAWWFFETEFRRRFLPEAFYHQFV